MASPTPRFRNTQFGQSKSRSRRTPVPGDTPEAVSPIWILKGIGLTVVAAIICGYLSVCLLFYQGQWQLVLHPSRSTALAKSIAGNSGQTVRFGVDESATPQLTGLWLPAESGGQYAAYTVLYLPSGDGSLADSVPTVEALHSIGLNLFAFDYRGYGQSAAIHPNERRMKQDADSAWQYLTIARAKPESKVILFGDGVGAFLAARLAAIHPEVPVVILDSPRPDLLNVVLADTRTGSLPVKALFYDRFDIKQSVANLKTPKLILITDPEVKPGQAGQAPPAPSEVTSLVEGAASPKRIVHLTTTDRRGTVYTQQLSRFLDEYLH